jgi:tripartite-type tricarboxylate transporter receptor subunit TctC
MAIRKSGWEFLSCLGLVLPLLLVSQKAPAQTDFYKGKTITIIHGRDPGGVGDMRARAVMTFLQKHIPGNPTIANEFMPGAGGRKAANYLYKTARPDGLTIASIGPGFVSSAVLGLPGAEYDIDKFIYLGAPLGRRSYAFGTRSEASLDTPEKLRAASGVRVGGQSVGHTGYIAGRLFAWIMGLKDPRFVTGYSGPELEIALMRGEIDARANTADTVVDRTPEWIEKGLVHFHSMMEIPIGFRHDHPVYKPLPSLESLTRTDRHRRVLAMFRNFSMIGPPFVAPPGIPQERAEILKAAFHKTFRDPAFFKEYEKLTGEPASPLTPEEQAQAIRGIPRDPETIRLFNLIAGPAPLPPS